MKRPVRGTVSRLDLVRAPGSTEDVRYLAVPERLYTLHGASLSPTRGSIPTSSATVRLVVPGSTPE